MTDWWLVLIGSMWKQLYSRQLTSYFCDNRDMTIIITGVKTKYLVIFKGLEQILSIFIAYVTLTTIY